MEEVEFVANCKEARENLSSQFSVLRSLFVIFQGGIFFSFLFILFYDNSKLLMFCACCCCNSLLIVYWTENNGFCEYTYLYYAVPKDVNALVEKSDHILNGIPVPSSQKLA
jgi:hypothetical protein